MPETQNTDNPIVLLPEGFENPKFLGGGAFGVAYICKYTGNDPEIRKLLTPSGQVVIKTSIDESRPLDDIEGISAVRDRSDTLQAAVMQGTTVRAHDKTFVVSQLSTIGQNESADIGSFFQRSAAASEQPLPSHLQSQVSQNSDIFLFQSMCRMIEAQVAMNSVGLLHRDIAARNFFTDARYDDQGNLIEVIPVLGDFGRVKPMDANGEYDTSQINENSPVRWIDHNTVLTGRYSTSADIFGTQVAIIEIMAISQQNLRRSEDAIKLNAQDNDINAHLYARKQMMRLENKTPGDVDGEVLFAYAKHNNLQNHPLHPYIQDFLKFRAQPGANAENLKAEEVLLESMKIKFLNDQLNILDEKSKEGKLSLSDLTTLNRLSAIAIRDESTINRINDMKKNIMSDDLTFQTGELSQRQTTQDDEIDGELTQFNPGEPKDSLFDDLKIVSNIDELINETAFQAEDDKEFVKSNKFILARLPEALLSNLLSIINFFKSNPFSSTYKSQDSDGLSDTASTAPTEQTMSQELSDLLGAPPPPPPDVELASSSSQYAAFNPVLDDGATTPEAPRSTAPDSTTSTGSQYGSMERQIPPEAPDHQYAAIGTPPITDLKDNMTADNPPPSSGPTAVSENQYVALDAGRTQPTAQKDAIDQYKDGALDRMKAFKAQMQAQREKVNQPLSDQEREENSTKP